MDDPRFDALTWRLAGRSTEGTNVRRSLLKGLAGAGLAAVFRRAAAEPATAAPNDDGAVDDRCRRKPAISNNRCTGESICRSTETQVCTCTRTVDGARACVDLTDEECPRRSRAPAKPRSASSRTAAGRTTGRAGATPLPSDPRVVVRADPPRPAALVPWAMVPTAAPPARQWIVRCRCVTLDDAMPRSATRLGR